MKVGGFKTFPVPFDKSLVSSTADEPLEDATRFGSYQDMAKQVQCRYSRLPLYRIVYLGENHQAAMYEVGALLGDPYAPISNPKGSWLVMSLKVRSASRRRPLCGRGAKEDRHQRTGANGRSGKQAAGRAPTQQLGAALFSIPSLEAFLFPSSKSGSRNLAIFPDKLDPRSSIIFHNELDGTSRTTDLALALFSLGCDAG